MLTSSLLRPAAWLLLLGTASASPAPVDANAAKTATLSSTSTVPADATGALVTASTGAAKPAASKNADVAACDSANAEFKPFCLPKNNEVFYPDSTHSIIWDPAFFPGSNGTLIKIIGFYTNNETIIPTKGPPKGEEEAFASDHIAAGWGYYQWKLSKSLLQAQSASLVNITLRIVALEKDGLAEWYTGPTVTLRYKPKKEKPPKPQKATDEHALYIALPTVFGVCLLVVAAIFFSNRQTRTIEIGDLVNRARKSSSRRKGLGGLSKKDRARNKEQSIRLMERSADSDEEAGWDEGWGESATTGGKRVDRKRV